APPPPPPPRPGPASGRGGPRPLLPRRRPPPRHPAGRAPAARAPQPPRARGHRRGVARGAADADRRGRGGRIVGAGAPVRRRRAPRLTRSVRDVRAALPPRRAVDAARGSPAPDGRRRQRVDEPPAV